MSYLLFLFPFLSFVCLFVYLFFLFLINAVHGKSGKVGGVLRVEKNQDSTLQKCTSFLFSVSSRRSPARTSDAVVIGLMSGGLPDMVALMESPSFLTSELD